MLIGGRIREIREARKLTQGDIERRTGLMCPYLSRIENNHSIPTLGTLYKLARALEIPIYTLFVDDGGPAAHGPGRAIVPNDPIPEKLVWLLARMSDRQRTLLLDTTVAVLRRKRLRPR